MSDQMSTCITNSLRGLDVHYKLVTGSGVIFDSPSSKQQLQEHQVQPPPELETHLAQVPDALEAQPLVEADRAVVIGIHTGHHDMLAEPAGARDQRRHQRLPDTAPAPVGPDVNGMLDRIAIPGPDAKVAEAREP